MSRRGLAQGKKSFPWYTRLGTLEIVEQSYRQKATQQVIRPFSAAAAIHSRGYSLGLQRVLSDFGADVSFAAAAAKVKEHYHIEVGESTVRRITFKHAQGLHESLELACQLPSKGAAQIIAQTDGCLVPIVKSQGKAGIIDKRKTRELVWQEARLSLARRCGVLNKHYQATLLGVEKAGKQLFDCAVKAGAGEPSSIHCVGDGATWIVRQVEAQFGRQASYLLDYYHLSEYLWKAAEGLSRKPVKWLHQQQERLKKNQAEKVLKALVGGVESAEIAEGEAPVRACWRYLSNRLEYVNYQGALEADLPIGSGEIESGNRSVIQGRLKIPGAWWKQENAEVMLALRAQRASGQWQSYWANLRQAAA